MSSRHTLIIPEKNNAERLDVFLSSSLGLTRSSIKSLIEKNRVFVNGKAVKAGYALKPGDTVDAELEKSAHETPKPEAIPLSIIHEDGDIIVINKPAGLPAHPGAGRTSNTLVNALLNHTKTLSTVGGPDRPGIVHRLDMDTTGAIIIAKNDQSHKNLARQFKEHSALKTYRAIVWGAVKNDEGMINLPIGRSSTHRKKMSTGAQKSRTALTRWRVLKRYPGLTLIQLTPETGRTHQLRVHLSAINHPVVGDKTYGLKKARPELSKTALDKIKAVKRQLLHAYSLEVTHPATGKRVEFIAEVPEDMQELIDFLDGTC